MDFSDFLSFLGARASVREYREEPVTPEDLEYLVRCASTAPSAGNREAWDVIAVTDQERRRDLSRSAYQQHQVEEAPLVLVVCAHLLRSASRYGERGALYAIQDATIACTYLMLSAHARGLHTCWVGAFHEGEVRTVLGIPEDIRPIALLAIGKGIVPAQRTGRIPPADHLHREYW